MNKYLVLFSSNSRTN